MKTTVCHKILTESLIGQQDNGRELQSWAETRLQTKGRPGADGQVKVWTWVLLKRFGLSVWTKLFGLRINTCSFLFAVSLTQALASSCWSINSVTSLPSCEFLQPQPGLITVSLKSVWPVKRLKSRWRSLRALLPTVQRGSGDEMMWFRTVREPWSLLTKSEGECVANSLWCPSLHGQTARKPNDQVWTPSQTRGRDLRQATPAHKSSV